MKETRTKKSHTEPFEEHQPDIPAGGTSRYKVAEWLIDPSANTASYKQKVIKLEPKAMEVLTFLASKQNQVISREEIETNIWAGLIVGYDSLTGIIQKLRKVFDDNPRNPKFIETIPKKGYRLVAEVTYPDNSSSVIRSVPTEEKHSVPPSNIRSYIFFFILISAAGSVAFYWLTNLMADKDIPIEKPASHSIAVIPFTNKSDDPKQEYFADGLTEDLITDLSKISSLRVIARNSTFAYKGSTETEHHIGEELTARYIIRGSVRKVNNRLRINVRLIDTLDGSQRWAERYDRDLTDIYKLQDRITHHIVSALKIELSPDERKRLVKDYTTSIEAYDLFLRGLDHYGRRSGEDNAYAQDYFKRAISIEPDFARAHASLALTYTINAINGWGLTLEQSLKQAETIAIKARQLDSELPQVHFVMGEVRMYQRKYVEAINELSKAIELKPSYADAHALLAWILHFAGRPEEGVEAISKAIDLNPRVPGAYFMVQGALKYQLQKNAEAVQLLEQAVENNPNYQLARVFLASAYSASSQLEAAEWQIAEILQLNPDFSLSVVEKGSPISDPAYKDKLMQDLTRAGLTY